MSELVGVKIVTVIKAPRAKVFAAWTQPELLTRWLAPNTMTAVRAVAQAHVGGRFEIEMRGAGSCDAGNQTHLATGTYRRVVPDELLEFTWQMATTMAGTPLAETVVTVRLKSVPEGTELTFTHDGFGDAERMGNFEKGWHGCFEKLAALLAAR
jgi:uncharacterized protein YndB with AHSA1/START domain